MYKNIKTIEQKEIENLNIPMLEYYKWVDFVVKNSNDFILPVKTRIPLKETDYFNVMPCVLPQEGVLGLKVVTRSEERRCNSGVNLGADILLYDYNNFNLLALIDGSFITTIRTAAIAVHSMLNIAEKRNVIAMLGLGNIGTAIGDILFELTKNESYIVKVYRYKDQAERFINRYANKYCNITFQIVDDYTSLMKNSDVVFSSVTLASHDFCPSEIYKKGCTIIPVHMRGFMDCDLNFNHIITSDLQSIKKFKYYDSFQKLSLLDEVLKGNVSARQHSDDRVLIYNLGLAIYDLYFAANIYKLLN